MPQHLFLPNASWPRPNGSTAQAPAIDLPNLREIWTHWHAIERVSQSDDWALPIERRYAEALGWRSGTATAPIPLAALVTALVTAQTSGAPQAALTPCAWLRPIHVISGMNDIIAQLPASMAMPEAHARAFFDAIKPLCDEDGMTLTWLTPGRWLLTGERLRGITTPSLARASNQHMAPYVPFVSASHLAKHPDAADNLKWLLRLQNEVQMLFYTHPMNDEREGAGLPTISGIWVEGAGALDGATVNGATVEWRDALMDVSDHFDQWQAANTGTNSDTYTRCSLFINRVIRIVERLDTRCDTKLNKPIHFFGFFFLDVFSRIKISGFAGETGTIVRRIKMGNRTDT